MPRAARPAAPADDLIAAEKSRGEPSRGKLTAELAAFCQSGISIVLGSRGADGRPVAGRALACTVSPNGAVRLMMARRPNQKLLEALARGGAIAATFTRPQNHRSIQLKSARARTVDPGANASALVDAQCANFRSELTNVGYSESFAATYCAWNADDLIAVEFTVDAAFVQTPGPGAGSALP